MRIAKWDNMKFILIYSVVLGHFARAMKTDSSLLNGLHVFIYTFHMPAFFFISGLFAKRTIREKRYDKALAFLMLYLFMKTFKYICNIYIYGKLGTYHILIENGVPWFALVLFFYYMITMLIGKWNVKYAMTAFCILGVMIGYDTNMGNTLAAMRMITFYPFFLLGYFLSVEKVQEFTGKRYVRALSVLILGGFGVFCIKYLEQVYPWLEFLKCKAPYESLKMLPYGGIYRAVYYVVAFVLIFALTAVVPSRKLFFSTWGKRSVQVFALHEIVMNLLLKKVHLKQFLVKLYPAHYGLLVPIVALIVTIVLSWKGLEPFFEKLMNPVGKSDKRSE